MRHKVYLIFLCLLVYSNCVSKSYIKYDKKGIAMGTWLTVTIFSNDRAEAEQILDECFDLSGRLEAMVSSKDEKSIISRLNVDKESVIDNSFVYDLIKEAVEYSEKTKGTFDPSLYNLSLIWEFENDEYEKNKNLDIPKKTMIDEALKSCGYKNIIFFQKKIVLKNNISLDLGGIAKGKIIGEIAKLLESRGIRNYLINGGGDIVTGGLYENKRLWKIAIQDPFKNGDNFIGFIDLSGTSIVTSGDYERYFTGRDGRRYHHIMDSSTGYPVNNGLHSVTVIAKDPALGDSYATALFVMGKEKGLEFANKEKEIGAIFVSGNQENKEVTVTNNIEIKRTGEDQFHFEYR